MSFEKAGFDFPRSVIRACSRLCERPVELALCVGLWLCAVRARLQRRQRTVDVGIGPEPIVSHRYQKEALRRQGFSAETFVRETYFITDAFDVCMSMPSERGWMSPYLQQLVRAVWLFLFVIRRYRCLFIHFHGGPLSSTRLLSTLEPRLLKQAGVRVVVSPYGSDIQDMRFAANLEFKHALAVDYPHAHRSHVRTRRNIVRWTKRSDHVISGCDWVDYMYHWDTLMLTDWCIERDEEDGPESLLMRQNTVLRVLHAPNHTTIKGTDHLRRAIAKLQQEGCGIELVLLQRVPNHQVLAAIRAADLIADQFVIGWYGFFALEAMSAGKPVMTYIKDQYVDLQIFAGNLGPEGIPVLNTRYDQVEDQLRWALEHREALHDIGRRSREFVKRHHSMESIGRRYQTILRGLGLHPGQGPGVAGFTKAGVDDIGTSRVGDVAA